MACLHGVGHGKEVFREFVRVIVELPGVVDLVVGVEDEHIDELEVLEGLRLGR